MPKSSKPKLYWVLLKWFMVTGIVCFALSLGMCTLVTYYSLKHVEVFKNWDLMAENIKREALGYWLGRAVGIIIIIFMSSLLIIYFLAKKLAGKIVMPLSSIAQKVGLFTEDYKSDLLSWAVLANPVYEEIDVLSQSFYRMAEKTSHLMESLEKQAQYDALTGLANRFYFYKRGYQVIELIQRNERVCSLIFLDIDRFKNINDTYGHVAGDQVLTRIAKLLESNTRISDVAGRVGGEEFAIILPDTELSGARLLAERLRRGVEEKPFQIGGNLIPVTISLGVAVYRGSRVKINVEEVLEGLIKKADSAMYRAKAKGRNRVEINRDDQPEQNQLKLFLADEEDVV